MEESDEDDGIVGSANAANGMRSSRSRFGNIDVASTSRRDRWNEAMLAKFRVHCSAAGEKRAVPSVDEA